MLAAKLPDCHDRKKDAEKNTHAEWVAPSQCAVDEVGDACSGNAAHHHYNPEETGPQKVLTFN